MKIIDDEKVNIEYMYGLSLEGDNAYVVLKASDINRLDDILADNNIETVSCEQIVGM